MSELPSSLRPWSAALAAFVPELALALGPTLRGLATALGPMRPQPADQGEAPDGFSGLSRRGSYERLLLSEWALADELPDEFLRRAATSEHLFLQLDRPMPRKGRRCVAWFDAGPDQLGGPRIVQLALLVVLARRAEQAGAALEWGHLQGDALHTGADQAGLQAMLAGSSARDPRSSTLDLLARSGPIASGDELWLVGGARTPDLRGASRMVLAEPLDRPDEIDVTLIRAHGPSRRLALPLPAPHLRTRLIRAPLSADAALPPAAQPVGDDGDELRFSPSGKWLIRPEHAGRIVARPLAQGKARRFTYAAHRWQPLALGFRRKTIGLFRHVSQAGYAIIASGTAPREFASDELHYPDDGQLLEVVDLGSSEATGTWFRDQAGVVWAWTGVGQPRAVGLRCVMLGATRRGPLWVSSEPESVLYGARFGSQPPHEICRFDLRGTAAFIGPSLSAHPPPDARHRDTLRVALVGEGHVQIWSDLARPRTREARPVPAHLRIRGLTYATDLGEALLVTDPDGADLRLWSPDGRERRVAPGPVRAAVASQGPVARIAWLLPDGSVWSCDATNGVPTAMIPARSAP